MNSTMNSGAMEHIWGCLLPSTIQSYAGCYGCASQEGTTQTQLELNMAGELNFHLRTNFQRFSSKEILR